jgi:hypothetical protein
MAVINGWFLGVLALGMFSPIAAQAAKLTDGFYALDNPGEYYDAAIETVTNDSGDVVAITERFDVEGIPSKPFLFTCDGGKCVNTEKPNWTITIISNMNYVDEYGPFVLNYKFVAPLPSDDDDVQ